MYERVTTITIKHAFQDWSDTSQISYTFTVTQLDCSVRFNGDFGSQHSEGVVWPMNWVDPMYIDVLFNDQMPTLCDTRERYHIYAANAAETTRVLIDGS